MKLSEKQRIYLVNGYDDAVFKQLNSSSRYVCNKCGTSNHGRKKYFLFNTKQNKIIKNTNGIFNDFVVYEKYLEAFHFWKNDYVVGESKIGLLYCPTYPADRLPNPFNIVQPSDPWTKRKDPKYPFEPVIIHFFILLYLFYVFCCLRSFSKYYLKKKK